MKPEKMEHGLLKQIVMLITEKINSITLQCYGDNLQFAILSHFGNGRLDKIIELLEKEIYGLKVTRFNESECVVKIKPPSEEKIISILFKKGFVGIKID